MCAIPSGICEICSVIETNTKVLRKSPGTLNNYISDIISDLIHLQHRCNMILSEAIAAGEAGDAELGALTGISFMEKNVPHIPLIIEATLDIKIKFLMFLHREPNAFSDFPDSIIAILTPFVKIPLLFFGCFARSSDNRFYTIFPQFPQFPHLTQKCSAISNASWASC